MRGMKTVGTVALTRKLLLNRETLRTLTPGHLTRVVGGNTATCRQPSDSFDEFCDTGLPQ
jgi:hypothetical protein